MHSPLMNKIAILAIFTFIIDMEGYALVIIIEGYCERPILKYIFLPFDLMT